MWTPPGLQAGFAFLVCRSRQHAYVRPVDAGSSACWPIWNSLTRVSSNTRTQGSSTFSDLPRPGPTCTPSCTSLLALLGEVDLQHLDVRQQSRRYAWTGASYRVCRDSRAQIVRASLFATAATATLKGRRASKSSSQGVWVQRAITALAPCISSVRK